MKSRNIYACPCVNFILDIFLSALVKVICSGIYYSSILAKYNFSPSLPSPSLRNYQNFLLINVQTYYFHVFLVSYRSRVEKKVKIPKSTLFLSLSFQCLQNTSEEYDLCLRASYKFCSQRVLSRVRFSSRATIRGRSLLAYITP